MRVIDLATRKFWRFTGRPVNLRACESWLAAPISLGSHVADGWLEAEAHRLNGRVLRGDPRAGLLASMSALNGPGFDAADLDWRIRDFYERTSQWRMEAWAAWSPAFWLGGELITRFFGARVQQLALPTRPLDVARGIDSTIAVITDSHDQQSAAAWLRTLRATGAYVFSGCYSVRTLPGADRPSVHVAFPLEAGNIQVFLRPYAEGGDLILRSTAGSFGADGAYAVVEDGGQTYGARLPIHETFHLYVDADGVLRTDHQLRIWNATAIRLHYKLEPV